MKSIGHFVKLSTTLYIAKVAKMYTIQDMDGDKKMDKIVISGAVAGLIVSAPTWMVSAGL